MPRQGYPNNSAQQSRQARYRERLAETREPESSRVDTAIATVVAGYVNLMNQGLGSDHDRRTIIFLFHSTLDLLKSEGFSRTQSKDVLMRRLHPAMRRGLTEITANIRPRFVTSEMK